MTELFEGIACICTTCQLRKKPIGRSASPAMANSLCDHECPGYHLEPLPGSLWPGETNEDFGYPVSRVGTRPCTNPLDSSLEPPPGLEG